MRVAVLTISDAGARGERADTSGDAIAAWAQARGATARARARWCPTRPPDRSARSLAWADGGDVDLILTTGGTGLTPRDVTPEATRAVLEREAPGIAEALRVTRASDVSRGPRFPAASPGVRGKTLIVNLPGQPRRREGRTEVLEQWIEHAVDLVRGERTDHGDVGQSVSRIASIRP